METILTLVIAGLIIQFASRFIFKLIGWVLIVGGVVYAMYHYGWGPFERNPISIQTWEEEYCNKPGEEVKCDCIVLPVKKDLEKRFTQEELKQFEKNRTEWLYVLQKSFEASQSEIEECLKQRQAEDQLAEFKKDMIPVDDDIIDQVDDLISELSEEVEEQFDSFKSRKEDIDDKYE